MTMSRQPPAGAPEQRHRQGIRHASGDLAIDLVNALRRRRSQARVALPLRLADDLLVDLEELNLGGRRRVPVGWEPRLARLVAALPAEVSDLPELRTNILATRLMDSLFELEDRLLDLKVGPLRAELHALDRELFELPGGDDGDGGGRAAA